MEWHLWLFIGWLAGMYCAMFVAILTAGFIRWLIGNPEGAEKLARCLCHISGEPLPKHLREDAPSDNIGTDGDKRGTTCRV